jgi:monofunctional biosynthetic peptidoglycan transglycosylase
LSKINRSWIFVLAVLLVSVFLVAYLFTVPDVSSLRRRNPAKTAYMKYREMESQRKGGRLKIHQTWVPLSSVSPYLVKAVLIAEDDKFWIHEGFDYEAIERAAKKDLKTGKFRSGGSTLSQQLARNLYLSPSKNLSRKAREAIITWRMERTLSKRRILELYLNVVEWGEGIFGAEAASRYYYGKSASELTAQESARLASTLPNPRKYNPSGNQSYVLLRSDLIYSIMIHRGIAAPEYEEISVEDPLLPMPQGP